MVDYDALCQALAANLASIDGLQESAYLLANPTPPSAEVQVGRTMYDQAMHRGVDNVTLIVRAFVAFSSDVGASKRIRTFLASDGPTSIKAAIESDLTLGGLADDLWVKECTGEKGFLREIAAGSSGRGSAQGPLLGAEWTVEVLLNGGG